jgi:hypothetical protein
MRHSIIIFASVFFAAVAAAASEGWWPQFRGPNCSGVSERPNRREVGTGTTSFEDFCVARRVLTMRLG